MSWLSDWFQRDTAVKVVGGEADGAEGQVASNRSKHGQVFVRYGVEVGFSDYTKDLSKNPRSELGAVRMVSAGDDTIVVTKYKWFAPQSLRRKE